MAIAPLPKAVMPGSQTHEAMAAAAAASMAFPPA